MNEHTFSTFSYWGVESIITLLSVKRNISSFELLIFRASLILAFPTVTITQPNGGSFPPDDIRKEVKIAVAGTTRAIMPITSDRVELLNEEGIVLLLGV